MRDDHVIASQKTKIPFEKTLEEERSYMELRDRNMISYREVIPKHSIRYAIYIHIVTSAGDLRSATDFSGKCIVTAMYTKCVYAALACTLQMKNTVMDSIEQSFPIKGATLEYDGNLRH
jgi:hypothetical protein